MTNQAAVLISLNISSWQATRRDQKISDAVTTAHEVSDKRLGRFWKSLLPKCDVVTKVQTTARAARAFHYTNTLAWMHDGPRMLPTANYEAYMTQMRKFKAEFEVAVLDLIAQYDDLKEEARIALGKMFNETDYPDKSLLKQRYDFDITIMTMPASEGFLGLGLAQEEAEELRAKLEGDMRETFRRANQRLWEDMYSRLEVLTARLADEGKSVREDTVKAVKDLAELLPRLNITNDDGLNVMAAQLKSALEGVSGASVRTDPDLRERVAAETSSVFNMMQMFMEPSPVINEVDEEVSSHAA